MKIVGVDFRVSRHGDFPPRADMRAGIDAIRRRIKADGLRIVERRKDWVPSGSGVIHHLRLDYHCSDS